MRITATGGGADSTLDLKGVLCPLNFVRINLALETMRKGEQLNVVLDPGRTMIEIPKSLAAEGHRIVTSERFEDAVRITIEKGA